MRALTTFRGELIAGGRFNDPLTRIGFIARLPGASWEPLGDGLNGPVNALCAFDPDGAGPMPDLLIAGGEFAGGGAARDRHRGVGRAGMVALGRRRERAGDGPDGVPRAPGGGRLFHNRRGGRAPRTSPSMAARPRATPTAT